MSMVERVARVIYKVDGDKGWHLHKKFYMDAARASIEAMREPSDVMIYAATQKHCLESGAQDEAHETWQAMISAALNEEG